MGNYRFRLSDMMPSAWLSKLKGINRTRKHPPSAPLSHRTRYFAVEPIITNRYHISPSHPKAMDTHYPSNTPKRSYSMKRTRRKAVYRPSPRVKLSPLSSSSLSAGYSSQATVGPLMRNSRPNHLPQAPEVNHSVSPTESSRESLSSGSDDGEYAVIPPASHRKVAFRDGEIISTGADIVIDVYQEDGYPSTIKQIGSSDFVSESVDLGISRKGMTELESGLEKSPLCRTPNCNFQGIRLRANSPKIKRRKSKSSSRKGVSSPNSNTEMERRSKGIPGSYAIVMNSIDPDTDFRESMLEMIVENNIQKSKDLEDLLACYLSLNSKEYHGIIIRAFEQIWLKIRNSRL